jgi:hypothetical protein
MTQQYYGGSDFDAFHRSNQRSMSTERFYDRAGPYGNYYDLPRHELRADYHGRLSSHAMIQEPEQPDVTGGPARRRIAVAVSIFNYLP